ncbi:succinoglycan biosynthesis protein [Agrobacterium rubi]|nr:succinoglycan biosynthesis protein [Agrobacterium rubi]
MRRKSGRGFRPIRDGFIFILMMVLGVLIAARLDGVNQERFAGGFYAVDGDTIGLDNKRFRLIGIDAPEKSQSCQSDKGEWACGEEAKGYLADIVKSGAVECFGNERDKYKRLLVRCAVNGQDVAGQMVSAGYAVTTEYFLFSDEQAQAQARRAGIWSGTFEQPRDWRREHKAADMDVPLAGVLSLVRHVLGW